MNEVPVAGIELTVPPHPEFLQLVRAVVGAAAVSGGGTESPLEPGCVTYHHL